MPKRKLLPSMGAHVQNFFTVFFFHILRFHMLNVTGFFFRVFFPHAGVLERGTLVRTHHVADLKCFSA